MSGFVFPPSPTLPVPPPATPEEGVIAADGWWPDVKVADVRAAVRLDTTVAAERIEDAIRQAMTDLALELAEWRAAQEAAGVTSLSQAPGQIVIGGQAHLVLRWFRAVYCTVAADLGERLIGQGLTSAGAERAEQLRTDIEDYRRAARFAVRDILGLARIHAELI